MICSLSRVFLCLLVWAPDRELWYKSNYTLQSSVLSLLNLSIGSILDIQLLYFSGQGYGFDHASSTPRRLTSAASTVAISLPTINADTSSVVWSIIGEIRHAHWNIYQASAKTHCEIRYFKCWQTIVVSISIAGSVKTNFISFRMCVLDFLMWSCQSHSND